MSEDNKSSIASRLDLPSRCPDYDALIEDGIQKGIERRIMAAIDEAVFSGRAVAYVNVDHSDHPETIERIRATLKRETLTTVEDHFDRGGRVYAVGFDVKRPKKSVV